MLRAQAGSIIVLKMLTKLHMLLQSEKRLPFNICEGELPTSQLLLIFRLENKILSVSNPAKIFSLGNFSLFGRF